MRSIFSTVQSLVRSSAKPVLLPGVAIDVAEQTLEVVGQVQNPLCLSVADLQAMPGYDWVRLTSNTCEGNPPKAQKKGYRGVLLREIVLKAGLQSDDPKGWKRAYVVARASDGYVALFSWNELINTDVGDAVLVVYRQHAYAADGEPGEHLSLVSGSDRHSGARQVKWLRSIELCSIFG
ncbi:molybdopterin-dependent oxidoreductase [Pseudomonas sp. Pseusp3]|uniref:molybdopterin-dependent oxidoreductase n=1 Tax=Pseudomonas sp. Pseusp3 TaxID=3243029 RepID=UPI0039AFC040